MPSCARTFRWLLAGFACLQTIDLICTYLLLGERSGFYEANPLARAVLEAGGWLGLAAFKFGVTAVALAACATTARRRPVVAVRVLSGLCVLMLVVNGYSGALLASRDAGAEQRANERSARLDEQVRQAQRFSRARARLCDAVLTGKLDAAEAADRLSETIRRAGPELHPPSAARLPDPSRQDELTAYLNYHLRQRARKRGLSDPVAEPEPAAPDDPLTPRWVAYLTN